MARQIKITDEMELDEAIGISRSFPLETLLTNFRTKGEGVTVWRAAEEVLADCPDPRTMPRMLDLLIQDISAQGDSAWFRPIKLRLGRQSHPTAERQLAISALLPLVDREVDEQELEPVAGLALDALSEAQPLPSEVVEHCSKHLSHPHSAVAASALRIIVHLPPNDRDRWVPLLLEQLQGRFSKDDEATWIIECLAPHFDRHRKQMIPVLRTALNSEERGIPTSVLEMLCRVGPVAAELVPDVLALLNRKKAYTNQDPYLVHIDPEGAVAIPGLIHLLADENEYANYQAASELEAYGSRAQPAVPALRRLANAGDQAKRFAATAAQRALLAIEIESEGGSVPERLSPTERLHGVIEDVISEGPEEE